MRAARNRNQREREKSNPTPHCHVKIVSDDFTQMAMWQPIRYAADRRGRHIHLRPLK
jgi:hypothetical protein